MSEKTYATHVAPLLKKVDFPVVTLSQDKIYKVSEFIARLAVEKQKESVHQIDGRAHTKRFFTGFACEAALEQLFGVDFMDTTVGQSEKYRGSDLKSLGLDIGVKGVKYEYDKFHTININIRTPQVICFLSADNKRVMVMGLASVKVLREHMDTNLVMDRSMADRKTGFYGYDKLVQFKTLDELKKLA